MKIKKGLQRKLRTPAVNDRKMMLFGQIACAANVRSWGFRPANAIANIVRDIVYLLKFLHLAFESYQRPRK